MPRFKYEREGKHLSNRKKFEGVCFPVSRHEEHKHIIHADFDELLSERECVHLAERYLSKVITEDYWSDIKDDLWFTVPTFTEWLDKMGGDNRVITRGLAMTDLKYYEGYTVMIDGGRRIMNIRLGS